MEILPLNSFLSGFLNSQKSISNATILYLSIIKSLETSLFSFNPHCFGKCFPECYIRTRRTSTKDEEPRSMALMKKLIKSLFGLINLSYKVTTFIMIIWYVIGVNGLLSIHRQFFQTQMTTENSP